MNDPVRRYDFDVKTPTKRPLAWVAFGAFAAVAGSLGWQLGGRADLGIGVVGFSVAIVCLALGKFIRDRRRPWRLAAVEIRPTDGLFVVEERRATSDVRRQTPIPLADIFTAASVVKAQERPSREPGWQCQLDTNLFRFRFPSDVPRAAAVGKAEVLERAAGHTPTLTFDDVRSDFFDVRREDDQTTIEFRDPFPARTALTLSAQASILFGATPLLDVFYGVPFGLVAVLLGIPFTLNIRSFGSSFPLRKRIVVSAETLSVSGPKPTVAVDEIRDVDLALVFPGRSLTGMVEAQIGSAVDEVVDSSLGAVTRQEVDSTDHGCLGILGTGVQMIRDLVSALDSRWLVAPIRGGFAEGIELAILLRRELARVANWEPGPGERPHEEE